jgi:hypothetical protein
MLRFEGSLVGMRFRPPALDIVNSLKIGDKLLAIREPGNPYDENAVAVYLDPANFDTVEGRSAAVLMDELAKELVWETMPALPIQLGYINKEAAAVISGQMAEQELACVECVHRLSFGGKPVVELFL